jgi:copper chaperone NosL
MKKSIFLLYLTGLLWLSSCSSGPEPFAFGKDLCHTCKMGIIDPKFGAELITKKGKIYKFDDVSCLDHYLRSNATEQSDISQLLVINFEKENDFLPIDQAVFILGPAVKSPMGSHAAAFTNREQAEKTNTRLQGELLSWKEVAAKLE